MAAARDSMFGMPSEKALEARGSSPNGDNSSKYSRTGAKSTNLNKIMSSIDRLEKPELQEQRFDTSKDDELAEIEIMEKLERALARRLDGQDAMFTRRAGRPSTAASSLVDKSSFSKEMGSTGLFKEIET